MFEPLLARVAAFLAVLCAAWGPAASAPSGRAAPAAGPGSTEPVLSEPAAQPIGSGFVALRARKIYTLCEDGSVPSVVEGGILLVRNGRVAAVGPDVAVPAGVRVVDFEDGVIIPGLVDAGSTSVSGRPGEETVSAKYRAVDAFDPYNDDRVLLAGGVTVRCLLPDYRRLVSGWSAVVKTAGRDTDRRILDEKGSLCVNLCASAYNPGGIQKYPLPAWSQNKIEPALPQPPTARLGQYLELRSAFAAAREYGRRSAAGPVPASAFDDNFEVLARALGSGPTLRIRALRAADIEGAVLLSRELGMKAVLSGCREAHRLASLIGDSKLAVILEVPFGRNRPLPEIGIQPGGIEDRIETASILAAAGVPLALTVTAGTSPAGLLGAAAAAVRGGLAPEEALKAVTAGPAEILKIAGRVGALVPGRDADFAVLSAEPFDVAACVRSVYVEGRSVFENPARRNALVVRAGTVLTAAGTPIPQGEVLVENGVIAAVGCTVPHPPGARIVDEGPDSVVTPGFIDGFGHLGLEGDGSVPGPEIPIAHAVAVEQENFRPVARAGVTTVILAPRRAHRSGSRVAAVKTAGRGRKELIVDDLAGIFLDFSGKDPVLGLQALRGPLKKGRDYDAAWKKYYEALKKWEEEQAKKKEGEAAAKKESAKPAEPKKEGEKKVEKKVEEKPDPVSGTWEATLSGGPMPRAMKMTLKLRLQEDGTTISGSATSQMGSGESPIEGTLQGTHVTLRMERRGRRRMSTVIEADLDAEDHMAGVFKIGDRFSLDFEATRVEKEAPVIKITVRRRRKNAGGRPEPPKKDERLEPFRKLFAKEIPLVVKVSTHREVEAAMKIALEEFKVPLVLLGASEADRVKGKIREAGCSVAVLPPVVGRKERKPYCRAADLSRAGIGVILSSDAEDGARVLPDMARFAVHNGMDAAAALEALTAAPARAYHIDDRVGSLAPGRDGDLVIFSGPPFQETSRVLRVFVAGKEVKP